ncbi:TPA: DUF2789 domain-containing protein [Pseudomonas aeruginosa]|uniref:DUF2789 domain-containing protein n=1 Tax=Pseudomonas TaxID=286 RepID=UPI0004CE2541|nr:MULTISPECIES: DUF2789 domain-containing protein [Pseudomonas]EJV1369472.1 DUF2789 domain-containing protein [Pseudomonas aeruginosa]EJV1386267.1 DUF2789 domain-containing protein [Pseudomonas aeruginosa]EJV1609517.1 DUF2789 domain-containing protein [Pseudomonas aeruginosa]EKD1566357.1 DUF2789 domain-containing protein [Pseudomonas aeruginosa]EKJ6949557.1 DUF2789 domain-containing protein [Pseudomonas aeruginosa]
MDKSTPRMTNLFRQLGLDSDAESISRFIEANQLAADVRLEDAPFWTDAQRQFLAEQIKADAAWAIVVDQLSESLHEDSVRSRKDGDAAASCCQS